MQDGRMKEKPGMGILTTNRNVEVIL
jgi:hypothetical protein